MFSANEQIKIKLDFIVQIALAVSSKHKTNGVSGLLCILLILFPETKLFTISLF